MPKLTENDFYYIKHCQRKNTKYLPKLEISRSNQYD